MIRGLLCFDSFCFFNKSFKVFCKYRMNFEHTFRMPLNTENIFAFMLDRFHNAIRSSCNNLETRSGIFYSLMMGGVGEQFGFAEDLGQSAAFRQINRVETFPKGTSVEVTDAVWNLGREILPEGSAESNIDHLNTTAHTNDWFAKLCHFQDQRFFVFVIFTIDISDSTLRFFTVKQRSNICTTRNQIAVDLACSQFCVFFRRTNCWKVDRETTGSQDRFCIAFVDGVNFGTIDVSTHNGHTDNWFHKNHRLSD